MIIEYSKLLDKYNSAATLSKKNEKRLDKLEQWFNTEMTNMGIHFEMAKDLFN